MLILARIFSKIALLFHGLFFRVITRYTYREFRICKEKTILFFTRGRNK